MREYFGNNAHLILVCRWLLAEEKRQRTRGSLAQYFSSANSLRLRVTLFYVIQLETRLQICSVFARTI